MIVKFQKTLKRFLFRRLFAAARLLKKGVTLVGSPHFRRYTVATRGGSWTSKYFRLSSSRRSVTLVEMMVATNYPAATLAGHSRRSVTLVEMMVATAVLSIGILGLIGSFQYLNKGLQITKGKSLANNLAQEKIEYLKNKSYYRVLVTTETATDANFSPTLRYDTYPNGEENIEVGGISFIRRVYIRKVSEDIGGNLTYVAWNASDTGLKEITVYVVWKEGSEWKKLELKNLLENPDRSNLSATFSGQVTDSDTDDNIEDATVKTLENPARYDLTDSDGDYSFAIEAGSYTLKASKSGYFSATTDILSISENQTIGQNFALTKMATGTINGNVYKRDHLVISRVVGSTVDASGFSQEYVEIFNPTTYTWTVNGEIGLKFQRSDDTSKKTILIDYFSASVPSQSFYLFSNTGTVTVNGEAVSADAVWSNLNPTLDFPYFATDKNIIPIDTDGSSEGSGALELYVISDSEILDQVGWDYNQGVPKEAPFYETDGIDQVTGLEANEIYSRFSSTNGVSSVYGPSYDSNSNNNDFSAGNINEAPRTTLTSTQTIIAGTPAEGTLIYADDGFSNTVLADSSGSFTLQNVVTGYWNIYASSGSLFASSGTFGGLSQGFSDSCETLFIDSSNTQGYISGNVTDSNLIPLENIKIYGGGEVFTDSNGNYVLSADEGEASVTANYSLDNPEYISVSSVGVIVTVGNITKNIDFALSKGGSLWGWITTNGVDAFPNIPVLAFQNDIEKGNGISGVDGYFYITGIATGTYDVSPQLDSGESSSPSTATVILGAGENVFVDTFTISGAMGYISGSVMDGSDLIKTGVLVYASTATITGGPPAIDSSLRAGSVIYYAISSDAEGNYSLPVRGGYAYNIYAWYTTWNGETPTITEKSYTAVSVSAAQTVIRNFNW